MPRKMYRRRPIHRTGRKLNRTQKKQVKRLITNRQELKYFPAASGGVAIQPITAASVPNGVPFDIAQGITDNARIGDSLMWAGKLELCFCMFNAGGATAQLVTNYRIILFQWHPLSTTTPFPVAGNILLNGPFGNPDVYSVYNHDNRQQYKILFDRRYKTTIQNAAAPSFNNDTSITGVKRYRISLRKATKHVQYNGGGLQATNRLFLLMMSDNQAATAPLINFTTKVFFRDA